MLEDKAIFWFGYALDDKKTLRSDVSARTHLYTAMQVIEKTLKGFLCLNGVPFKPGHNVSLYASQCHLKDDRFPAELLVKIADLPSYKELFRYPDETQVFYPTIDDVKTAINVMNETLAAIKSMTPQHLWDEAIATVREHQSDYSSHFKASELVEDEVETSIEADCEKVACSRCGKEECICSLP